jgi:alpha-L-rhamnosidase
MPASLLTAPTFLRTESFVNPLGLGETKPILSWRANGAAGSFSKAWRIVVAASSEALASERDLTWDSGWVAQERVNQAAYAGPALGSRQRCWWKVALQDGDGAVSPWSQPAFFELGLLQRSEWTGKWIGSSVVGGPRTTSPAPYLRTEFAAKSGIASARLYVTALGLYECRINGARVGEDVFTPGWTEYRKRVQYQVYEVTDLLRPGANAIGAILGDGWYCGYIGWRTRQYYGDRPRFLAQLEITFADGSRQIVATDQGWKTASGPILESDLMMGESYDARLDLGTWSSPGYDEKGAWHPVRVFPDPGIELTASASPRVRQTGELRAKGSTNNNWEWNKSSSTLDFGQNLVGRARIKVKAPAGTTIRLRYAEVLNPNGSIYTENLRAARCTDCYTCSGDKEETWESRFTFHGFRYVEYGGLPDKGTIEVTAVVLHSDTPPAGQFACSNPLLNQLQHNIQWGQKGNFLEVPTDCPQRDERLGWTGDAQVFIRTACFNMDVQGFFNKWALDLRDSQGTAGQIGMVIPNIMEPDTDGGPAWADATIICPWTIYLCYGDLRVLERHYESMGRFMNFLEKNKVKDLIRVHPEADASGGFGDWLALDAAVANNCEGATRKDLIGTAFFAYDADLMANIAGLLGKKDDAARYRELHGRIVQAFRRRFVTGEGLLAGGTQTSYVLALHFGLLPVESHAVAVSELVRDIQKRGNHLSTGFVGTPYLCSVLAEHGQLDLAYKLLEQETAPSWLFPVKNGATTIWERWDGWTPEKGFQDKGMNSFNHYAYGAIGAWMYGTVAGLEIDPAEPGYRHIIFRPRPGGTLTWAEAKLPTPLGDAGIRWELKDGALDIQLTVPLNAQATLSLPEGYVCATIPEKLSSGPHRFGARKK